MSLPEGYFDNQLVKIPSSHCRTRILLALHQHEIESEEILIMIVKRMNCQERVAYFLNDFKMEKNDALCLTNAIEYSEPQAQSFSQMTHQYQASPPSPPIDQIKKMTLENAATPSGESQISNLISDLGSIIEKIKKSIVKLNIYQNDIVDDCSNYHQITKCQISSLQSILNHLEIEQNDEYHVQFDFPTLLNDTLESPCQNKLNEVAASVLGMSSSNGELKTQYFTQPMVFNGNEYQNISALSGKIDFVSSIGPLFIELKARDGTSPNITAKEIDGLQQILNRLYRLRCSFAQIQTAVGFVVTSSHAWCLIFQRDRHFNESISIFKVFHRDIFHIWSSVTAYFTLGPVGRSLTNDAPFINSCLLSLGLHPSLCGVMIEKYSIKSTHRVYKIYLPRRCQYLSSDLMRSGQSVVGVPFNAPDFCIKIHQGHDEYAREANCIERVLESLNDEDGRNIDIEYKKNFFALKCLKYCPINTYSTRSIDLSNIGVISQHTEAIMSMLKNQNNETAPSSIQIKEKKGNSAESSYSLRNGKNINSPIPVETPSSSHSSSGAFERLEYLSCSDLWDFFYFEKSFLQSFGGGAIIMNYGERIDFQANNIYQVFEGISQSLRIMHGAGICHRDIRETNILQFGSTYQLIDYDLSDEENEIMTFIKGAQFDNRGLHLMNFKVGDEVTWSQVDDIQMLARFIARLSAQFKAAPAPSSHK